jgi:hypothetical protein
MTLQAAARQQTAPSFRGRAFEAIPVAAPTADPIDLGGDGRALAG